MMPLVPAVDESALHRLPTLPPRGPVTLIVCALGLPICAIGIFAATSLWRALFIVGLLAVIICIIRAVHRATLRVLVGEEGAVFRSAVGTSTVSARDCDLITSELHTPGRDSPYVQFTLERTAASPTFCIAPEQELATRDVLIASFPNAVHLSSEFGVLRSPSPQALEAVQQRLRRRFRISAWHLASVAVLSLLWLMFWRESTHARTLFDLVLLMTLFGRALSCWRARQLLRHLEPPTTT